MVEPNGEDAAPNSLILFVKDFLISIYVDKNQSVIMNRKVKLSSKNWAVYFYVLGMYLFLLNKNLKNQHFPATNPSYVGRFCTPKWWSEQILP